MISLPAPLPQRRYYFVLRIILTAVVLGLLIRANATYFFHNANYDTGDQAANTLSVLRAEHGQELYGQYSRWGFRHPGPAVFYGEGLAELTLYRWLHIVPTPYNAQVLFVTFLMTSLAAAGLSVAARWINSGMFLVLALTFAVLHFTAANASTLLLSNWPAYVIPMPMFALLVAAASVAAGRGEDLPLLALAGCLLLHMHVAQPLFVVPMFVLAYAGLILSCRRRIGEVFASPAPAQGQDTAPPPMFARATLALPFRAYRSAHQWGLVIAALFALPLVVDLFFGVNSNFFLLLDHLRNHRGEHHPFVASLDYFLRFAVYQPSRPGAPILLTAVSTWGDVLRFILRHPQMMLLWLVALLSPVWSTAARLTRARPAMPPANSSSDGRIRYEAPPGRWSFLGSLWLFWALSVGLTLFWGHIQDGDMFYFNTWFNYAIWYVLALLAAGAFAEVLDIFLWRTARPALWRGGVTLVCATLAVATVCRHPQGFLLGTDPTIRGQMESVIALQKHEPPGTPRAKLLLFPDAALPTALGVAVLLARADQPAYVLPSWGVVFGRDHILKDWKKYVSEPISGKMPFEVWRFVPSESVPGNMPTGCVLGPFTLIPGGFPVDPSSAFSISCAGKYPNSLCYVGKGWALPGNDTSVTDEKIAWLQFQPHPVDGGKNVEIAFDFTPYLPPGKREAQRIKVYFNGVDLGSLRVDGKTAVPGKFLVPGAVWNKFPSALLALEFPDGISAREISGVADDRPLAFLIRSLTFSTVPGDAPSAGAVQPAVNLPLMPTRQLPYGGIPDQQPSEAPAAKSTGAVVPAEASGSSQEPGVPASAPAPSSR